MKQKQYFNLNNNLYKFNHLNNENIKIYFSTKNEGHSTGAYANNNLALHVGDDNQNVIANRYDFAKQINQNLENFVYTNQTHSANVYEVTTEHKGAGILDVDSAIADCDGIYTFADNIVLNAFVADCTPVYFINEAAHLVGVIHAGWQGTVKSIVYKAINDICQKHHLNAADFKLIIGPSIEMNNFEVGQDVIDLINKMDYLDYTSCYEAKDSDKFLANVKRLNYLQALAAGLKEENIFVTDLDTYTNENLHSYRLNNQTGRMSATIYQTTNN